MALRQYDAVSIKSLSGKVNTDISEHKAIRIFYRVQVIVTDIDLRV